MQRFRFILSLVSLAIAEARLRGLRHAAAQTLRFFAAKLCEEGELPSVAVGIKRLSGQPLTSAAAPNRIFRKPTITIIADLGLQQCTKYRVSQKVELLTRMGARVFVADQTDYFRAKNFIQVSTRVIFYRAVFNDVFDALITEVRRCGVFTYYDLDDPIFSSEIYRGNSNIQDLSKRERASLISSANNYLAAMQKVDAVIASTPELLRAMVSEVSKPAFLWRNLLDEDTRSISESVINEKTNADHDGLKIFYGSGSRAHDADFGQITKVLSKFLGEFPKATLHLYGHLAQHQTIGFPRSQTSISPFSSYREYLRSLASADVAVVPLESSRFNQCKSTVRFLDASAVQVPTIASACGDYLSLPKDEAGLTLCSSQEEWMNAMRRMATMAQPERAALGRKARGWVINTCSTALQPGKDLRQIDLELLQHMGVLV